MSVSEGPRELVVNQNHIGTLLLAALIGLAATCLVAAVAMALVWHLASWVPWLLCLFVPAVCAVLFAGTLLFNWCERCLPRLWPSGQRLVLDREHLTLARRDELQCQIHWGRPIAALRWRVRGNDLALQSDLPPGQLFLACQLAQNQCAICVYTSCSSQEWRRVPGWKQFPFLEVTDHRSGGSLRAFLPSIPSKRLAAPAHRGASSLAEADPKTLWPAEYHRRRKGWELSFEDFCVLMATVEQSMEKWGA